MVKLSNEVSNSAMANQSYILFLLSFNAPLTTTNVANLAVRRTYMKKLRYFLVKYAHEHFSKKSKIKNYKLLQ